MRIWRIEPSLFLFVNLILSSTIIYFTHPYIIFSDRWFKLKMFLDDQGSWMTMFFTTILSLFIVSHIYNLLLMIGGESTLQYRIDEHMGIRNSLFLKAAATGTWCGDFFTAWMVGQKHRPFLVLACLVGLNVRPTYQTLCTCPSIICPCLLVELFLQRIFLLEKVLLWVIGRSRGNFSSLTGVPKMIYFYSFCEPKEPG